MKNLLCLLSFLVFLGGITMEMIAQNGYETTTVKKAKTTEKESSTMTPNSDLNKTNRMILISTDFGNMKVKLYDETPQHRDNFIKLVEEGFYNDLLFHRVIKGFMVQGGDPGSRNAAPTARLGAGGPGYKVPAEFVEGLYHKKGALSAARQGDQVNPTRASSGSQFYIVQGKPALDAELNMMEMQMGLKFSDEQKEVYKTIGGTPFLDNNYTVFGEVVEGLDIIDKIADVATMPGDRPLKDVKMTMTVVEE